MKQSVRKQKSRAWEQWPFLLRYAPLMPLWLWYCLRARSLWFFTPSNPTITFGGFEGEGKKEMYALLPPGSYPPTLFVLPGEPFDELLARIGTAGFAYPFIVKPDVGMKGLLFRKIDNAGELRDYHAAMPVEYMVQDLVDYPLELSIFYYRYPDQQKGIVSGFIRKDVMEVRGDGVHTLLQLVEAHPTARFRMEEVQAKHGPNLGQVLPEGELYKLAHAANLNRGAQFSNLQHLVDAELADLFDRISIPAQFFYGRFDLKCESVEALKKGERFAILEYNGSGAEPNHVYQADYGWFAALREIARHWRALFRISRANHRRGIPYWSYRRGLRFLRAARAHFRLLEAWEQKIRL